ncbi:MAG: hypothetical protein OER96_01270 [Gammaproteobacteria bacterium]|nr:hypothetical protein [Gammaproteobacteria bacterium]
MASIRTQDLRRVVCEETAKIVIDEGIRDYQHAKLKACERLSVNPDQVMPGNIEIEQAVATRLRIFDGAAHDLRYRQRIQIALELMDEFESFHPRVNSDSINTPTERSALELHTFADTPEDIYLQLHEHGIPFHDKDKRFRFNHTTWRQIPAVSFIVDEVSVDVCIFRHDRRGEIPRSQIDGNAITRLKKKRLQELLQECKDEID